MTTSVMARPRASLAPPALLGTSLLALILLGGCGSRLSVSVYRFQMDYAARAAYAASHPADEALRARVYRLRTMRERLVDYRVHLSALSELLAAAAQTKPAAALQAIDRALAPLRSAVMRDLARVYRALQKHGPHRSAGPADPDIDAIWAHHALAIGGAAPRHSVVVDETGGEHALRQLARSAANAWRRWATTTVAGWGAPPDTAKPAARPSRRDGASGLDPKRWRARLLRALAAEIARAKPALSDEAVLRRVSDRFATWMRRARQLRREISRSVADASATTGRHRRRRRARGHADPFLAYVAAHPRGFKRLGSGVSVRARRGRSVVAVFDRRGIGVARLAADRTSALRLHRGAALQALELFARSVARGARRGARPARALAQRDGLLAIKRYARQTLGKKLDAANVDAVLAQLRRRLRALGGRSGQKKRRRRKERRRRK